MGCLLNICQIHPLRPTTFAGELGKPARVGAVHGEHRRHTRLVVNLDEERAPALLHQFRFRRALLNLHPALRIDLDAREAVLVEDTLDLLDCFGLFELLRVGCR